MDKTNCLRKTETRGLATAWLEAGDRKASKAIAIFLHGCPDDAETWRHQFDHFKSRYLVVAPYARGVAPSQPAGDRRRYGLDAMALDHLEILRQVDPSAARPIFVVGHDLGGPQAWKLASLLGPRLAGLAVINGPSLTQMARRLTNPRQLLKSYYIGLLDTPGIAEALLRLREPSFVRNAYRKGERPSQGERALGSISAFVPQYRALSLEMLKVLATPWRKPLRIKAPVLALWGSRDAFLEVPTRDELEREASDVTLRVLEGNHWLHESDPARVNRLLQVFFEQEHLEKNGHQTDSRKHA